MNDENQNNLNLEGTPVESSPPVESVSSAEPIPPRVEPELQPNTSSFPSQATEPKKINKKTIALIAGVVLIVAIGVAVGFMISNSSSDDGKKEDGQSSKNNKEFSEEELAKRGEDVQKNFEELGGYLVDKYQDSSEYDFIGDTQAINLVKKLKTSISDLGAMIMDSNHESLKTKWQEFEISYSKRVNLIEKGINITEDAYWIEKLYELVESVAETTADSIADSMRGKPEGRDKQRRDDVARFASVINAYQTNNRGAIPLGGHSGQNTDLGYTIRNAAPTKGSLAESFLNGYLSRDSGEFNDPQSGDMYGVQSMDAGDIVDGVKVAIPDTDTATVLYVSKARCDGEDIVGSGGKSRSMAIRIKLENGSFYCQDNQ